MRIRNAAGSRAPVAGALTVLALAVAFGSPPALAQSPPKLTGLGQDTLTVKAAQNKDTAKVTVPVLNAGGQGAITVSFEASNRPADTITVGGRRTRSRSAHRTPARWRLARPPR